MFKFLFNKKGSLPDIIILFLLVFCSIPVSLFYKGRWILGTIIFVIIVSYPFILFTVRHVYKKKKNK